MTGGNSSYPVENAYPPQPPTAENWWFFSPLTSSCPLPSSLAAVGLFLLRWRAQVVRVAVDSWNRRPAGFKPRREWRSCWRSRSDTHWRPRRFASTRFSPTRRGRWSRTPTRRLGRKTDSRFPLKCGSQKHNFRPKLKSKGHARQPPRPIKCPKSPKLTRQWRHSPVLRTDLLCELQRFLLHLRILSRRLTKNNRILSIKPRLTLLKSSKKVTAQLWKVRLFLFCFQSEGSSRDFVLRSLYIAGQNCAAEPRHKTTFLRFEAAAAAAAKPNTWHLTPGKKNTRHIRWNVQAKCY